MDIDALVEELGGYARRSQLVGRGASDRELAQAVRSGCLSRVRQGWYTTRPLSSPESRALRIGGRLTGLSAIATWGGWVLSAPVLHVSVPDNAARLRPTGKRVCLHWDCAAVGSRGTVTSVGLADALARVIVDEVREVAVAALDWALHTGRLDPIDFERMLLGLPRELRGVRDDVDATCESLPESLGRTRLRRAGHRVRSQVPLGTERIDLVIDDLVGLETDGDEFHRERFERDRRKDIAMARSGLLPLRVPARMVFHEWPTVEAAIDQLLHNRVDVQRRTYRTHAPRRRL